ncbi:HAD family hydrolase [Acidisphaera sp. S103]|uniref:HAD-IIIC family phosphatase n=1 Tax=Acidisphaera sp. S103 TaxID=1747223 RepID=UPI00131B3833|nr:HAD-IIIC family phosphatase [Acidisphaera sp. S103]
MLDRPTSTATFLSSLGFGDKPATLPSIFQAGDRIFDAAAEPSAIPGGTTMQLIAVVGALTIDYLARAIACSVVQEGVFPFVYQAPFGSYVQEVLDPGSGLHGFGPELVVIAPDWRDMVVSLPVDASARDVDAALASKVGLLQAMWGQLAGKDVKVIQHVLVPPAWRYRGVAERLAPASPANQIRRLNEMLLEAGRGLVTWVDMDALAREIGTRRFAPAKFHHAARLDHDPKFLPDYLPLFRSAWRSANARAKKVLVLDLDNTLWGGVIGDDGVEGIALGSESPAGEAFADWQRYVKALGERGVILAVCSKNDPAVAAAGFEHPHSVLRRSDFSAFECSWNDKVAGLRRIARDLNVGIDSFVFCDDNPAECNLVQRELPEVAVVCLGADPAAFVDLFDAGHWLDTDHYTREDLGRAAAYTARAAALAEQAEATDFAGYLAGLGMKGSLQRPREADIARVAQLELKTNQFNVTTRRHSEAAIRGFLDRNDAIVLAFRLADRFGDHGLTSTLVAFHEGDTVRIDSWLMSCRIFSRSAEQFMMHGLIAIAAELGAKRLLGEYLPTPKNGVVEDLYPRLGFASAEGSFFIRDIGGPIDNLVTYVTDSPV